MSDSTTEPRPVALHMTEDEAAQLEQLLLNLSVNYEGLGPIVDVIWARLSLDRQARAKALEPDGGT